MVSLGGRGARGRRERERRGWATQLKRLVVFKGLLLIQAITSEMLLLCRSGAEAPTGSREGEEEEEEEEE
jgi:hypothetical protein